MWRRRAAWQVFSERNTSSEGFFVKLVCRASNIDWNVWAVSQLNGSTPDAASPTEGKKKGGKQISIPQAAFSSDRGRQSTPRHFARLIPPSTGSG